MKPRCTRKTRNAKTRPITYTATRRSLTIKLQGKAFENLNAAADAMNATSWCDTDNTPESVFRVLLGSFIDALAAPSTYYENIACGGIGEAVEDLIDGLDTAETEGTPADKRKREELRTQLRARGLVK